MKTKLLITVLLGFNLLCTAAVIQASCIPSYITVNSDSDPQTSVCTWGTEDEKAKMDIAVNSISKKEVSVEMNCVFTSAPTSDKYIKAEVVDDTTSNTYYSPNFKLRIWPSTTVSLSLSNSWDGSVWSLLGYTIPYVAGNVETCTFTRTNDVTTIHPGC